MLFYSALNCLCIYLLVIWDQRLYNWVFLNKYFSYAMYKNNSYYFEENISVIMEDSSVSTNTIKCEQWEAVLKKDHSGVRWESSHHLCKDWSESYINSMMSAPAQNIPWKWSFCKCHMISNYYNLFIFIKINKF